MDWIECTDKKYIKMDTKDILLVKSLIKTSNDRILTADSIKITTTSSNSVISLCYDALREVLECIANINGYKIYNHACYTALIIKVLKDEPNATEFDNLRKTRNNVCYYGQTITLEDATVITKKLKNLREKLIKNCLKNY